MTKAREMSEVLVGQSLIKDVSDDTGLIIKKNYSQTDNILELIDANDNILNAFDKDGDLVHLHVLDDVGETSQNLGDIFGNVIIDLSLGNTIIMNVVGEVTSLSFINPTGHNATNFRILLVTDGSEINWQGPISWVGYVPDIISAGKHGIIGSLVGEEYILEYLGRDFNYDSGEITGKPFKITIRIDNPNEEFVLPLDENGEYLFRVNWGDGDESSVYSYDNSSKIHTYSSVGDYQISITGTMTQWGFKNKGSRLKVISIDSWGSVGFTSLEGGFYGCSNLTSVAAGDDTNGDVTGVEFLDDIFRGCYSLTTFPVIDTNMALSVSGSWYGCTGLTSFPDLPFGRCVDFSYTWGRCTGLTSFPEIETTSGTNFAYAWYNCESLTSFPTLSYRYANDLRYAWFDCSQLVSFGSAGNFDFTPGSNFDKSFTSCSLDAESVNNILVSVDYAGIDTGVMRLSLDGGGNSTPGAEGLVAKDSLESKGWIVEIN